MQYVHKIYDYVIPGETSSQCVGDLMITRVIDCVLDDQLKDITFNTFVKRLSLLSLDADISDPAVKQQVNYAIQLLWGIFTKSSHSLKQKFAKYVASEPHLVKLTLEAICKCFKLNSKFVIA